MMILKPPQRDDADYITMQQAVQLTGRTAGCLYYHVARGHIRARTFPSAGRGRWPMRLHIDDVQICAYPRLRELARATNYSVEMIHHVIANWQLPGLVRFGGEWRINPEWMPRIVRWLATGRPVDLHFTPRERAR